jgi:hypothetical protein
MAFKSINDLTPEDAKRHRLLGSRVLRAFPSSPQQITLKAEYRALKIELGMDPDASGFSYKVI